jgi:hypothetical protein
MDPRRIISLGVVYSIAVLSIGLYELGLGEISEKKGRAALDAWLEDVVRRAPADSAAHQIKPNVIPIENESIRRIFPEDDFYAVYYPRWPRAILPPKELSNETILCVKHATAVEPIRGEDGLRTFLARTLTGIGNDPRARDAVLASLWLAAFDANGGPYELDAPDVSVTHQGGNIIASARAAVKEPARGNIEIAMEFNPNGQVSPSAIKISSRARRGPPSS